MTTVDMNCPPSRRRSRWVVPLIAIGGAAAYVIAKVRRPAPKLSDAAVERLTSQFDAHEWNNPAPDDIHMEQNVHRERIILPARHHQCAPF